MKKYFAYTRVSTDKQGEHGVSLQEQKAIIERYSSHKGLGISRWFEEMETASKVGRPVFNEMLALLKNGSAAGVVIHKVDRGARNFRDWAEIGELVDAGIEVHFATESLDLNTLGGMLSADLQAVMSVHYSRNLREEVKKGYYGRLKQGLCPRPAPLGYLNNGDGKVKTIDPIRGPLVRQAFELYATGRYSLDRLTEELFRTGLRTRATRTQPGDKRVGRTSIAAMLANPFYIGVLHVKKASRTFAGVHEPLISKYLFEKVQGVLAGKSQRKVQKHRFRFSRLMNCALCGRSLVGEAHKGHVYYRCHSKHATTILREEYVQQEFLRCFQRLRLSSEEDLVVNLIFAAITANWDQQSKESLKAEELRMAAIEAKLGRLTDAYLDGMLDRAEVEQKKTALTLERRESERRLREIREGDASGLAQWHKIVELIKTAYLLYEHGNLEENDEMVDLVMSNRVASGKTLDISLRFPFSEIAKRDGGQSGCPPRTALRTFWEELMKGLVASVQRSAAHNDPLCA